VDNQQPATPYKLLIFMIILFNKPFNVLCQFSGESPNLADYIDIKGVYPAGRLDKDSEGLLLLTDDGALQHLISHPKFKQPKTYWVQVEGVPDMPSIEALRHGVQLKDGLTRPARVKIIEAPGVWPRHPPIRYRANIPTTWLEITISEGRNRQVRRMTAAVGHPTLRLIRYAVGDWNLDCIEHGLQPGQWHKIAAPQSLLKKAHGQHKTTHSPDRRRHHRKRRKVPARRGTG
jgi:23S rRNA pseudouridine2457 synthase